MGTVWLKTGMAEAAQLHIFDVNLMTNAIFLHLKQKLGVDSYGLFGPVLIFVFVPEANKEYGRMRRFIYQKKDLLVIFRTD